MEERKKSFYALIEILPEEQQILFYELINQIIKTEKQLTELNALPHLLYNKTNPNEQRITPAGKLYKERIAVYQNLLTTFTKLLKMQGATGTDDDLLKALSEFADDAEE